MSKARKWSEQCLVESTFTTQDETGNKVEDKVTRYEFCYRGMDLYRKSFMQDNNRRKILFSVPFDFFVFPDFCCPRGQFYELEYFIGERGFIYRALLQVVNPVTDIPFVLGVLRASNLIPKDFNPIKARLRSDIEEVWPCSCSKDEEGEPTIFSGPKKPVDGDDISIVEMHKKNAVHGMSFDYYRGDVREVWTPMNYECHEKPVFVCGSENVNDPAFKQQRDEALAEMHELVEQANEIAEDYGVNILMAYTYEQDEKVNMSITASADVLNRLVENKSLLEVVSSLVAGKFAEGAADTKAVCKKQRKEKKNTALEEHVIGSFLADSSTVPNELYVKLMRMVANRSFSDTRHHLIAIAICSRWRKNEPVDVLTVADWLETNKMMEEAGGSGYLTGLSQSVVSSYLLARHMAILERDAQKSNENE